MRYVVLKSPKYGYVVELLEDEVFMYHGIKYIVPKGFLSDGFSVPKCFWWLLSPISSKCLPTGIFHDYLYKYMIGSRLQADQWLQGDLVKHGFWNVIAWLIFLFIRMLGKRRWGTP